MRQAGNECILRDYKFAYDGLGCLQNRSLSVKQLITIRNLVALRKR